MKRNNVIRTARVALALVALGLLPGALGWGRQESPAADERATDDPGLAQVRTEEELIRCERTAILLGRLLEVRELDPVEDGE